MKQQSTTPNSNNLQQPSSSKSQNNPSAATYNPRGGAPSFPDVSSIHPLNDIESQQTKHQQKNQNYQNQIDSSQAAAVDNQIDFWSLDQLLARIKQDDSEDGQQQAEVGYFCQLNADFKSTEEEIRNNYLSITSKIHTELKRTSTEQGSNSFVKNYISQLKSIITAYRFLSEEKERNKYINMIRLRSLVSQMLELNFVENVMNDRYKDHICRSYHFSMIKKVVKGYKYDEFFIEFNNDKPITYYANFPLQRDFIVEIINLAIDEIRFQNDKNKGINNPDNHNLSKKSGIMDIAVKTSLDLKFIMDDFVLPPKSIAKACVMKKNKSVGYEKRYLLLGYSQLIIARDPEYFHIVNVIPLEGGYVMVKKPPDFSGLVIQTHLRNFQFKFQSQDELVSWYHHLQSAISKEVKIKKYTKRVMEQHDKMSNQNKAEQYKKILNDAEEKINELMKVFTNKRKFEKENLSDLEFKDFMEKTNKESKLQEKLISVGSQIIGQNFLNGIQTGKTSREGQLKGQGNNNGVNGSNPNVQFEEALQKSGNNRYERKTLAGKNLQKAMSVLNNTNTNSVHQEPQDSDYDEFIIHKDGNEEIHITGKARKQLQWPLLHGQNVEKSKNSIKHPFMGSSDNQNESSKHFNRNHNQQHENFMLGSTKNSPDNDTNIDGGYKSSGTGKSEIQSSSMKSSDRRGKRSKRNFQAKTFRNEFDQDESQIY
ncbi:UNKNOWN [Stylonychia lemnae]|uniref:PH domain-containing protein n=1 Tax=Stylonychia lemnae TaxID=5949 RepID=A0A078ANR7_STYLE|nr:UNKNOWN [Stylonychia lemnae]|eukprot:CDW83809.1 UNKNOWN [Stylonychia lemnae]